VAGLSVRPKRTGFARSRKSGVAGPVRLRPQNRAVRWTARQASAEINHCQSRREFLKSGTKDRATGKFHEVKEKPASAAGDHKREAEGRRERASGRAEQRLADAESLRRRRRKNRIDAADARLGASQLTSIKAAQPCWNQHRVLLAGAVRHAPVRARSQLLACTASKQEMPPPATPGRFSKCRTISRRQPSVARGRNVV